MAAMTPREQYNKESTMKADAVKLADEFRQSLGFRTWPAQEDFARSAGHYPRRSGRTARGLLDVIAGCVAHDLRVLHVVPTGVIACTEYCASMAREFIAKLRLDIRVEVKTEHPERIRPSPGHYFDHYQIELQRRADESVSRDTSSVFDLSDPPKHKPHFIQSGYQSIGASMADALRAYVTKNGFGDVGSFIGELPAPSRPDGFAQSKIDEIKAMLTAPVAEKR